MNFGTFLKPKCLPESMPEKIMIFDGFEGGLAPGTDPMPLKGRWGPFGVLFNVYDGGLASGARPYDHGWVNPVVTPNSSGFRVF